MLVGVQRDWLGISQVNAHLYQSGILHALKNFPQPPCQGAMPVVQGGSLVLLQPDQIFRSIDARRVGYEKNCTGLWIELLSDDDGAISTRDREVSGGQFWGGGLAVHTPEKSSTMGREEIELAERGMRMYSNGHALTGGMDYKNLT
jgi:hypothetical protein